MDPLASIQVSKKKILSHSLGPMRSPQKARTAQKYMGKAPGVPNSDTRPRIRSTGRKFEMARGRRKSPEICSDDHFPTHHG